MRFLQNTTLYLTSSFAQDKLTLNKFKIKFNIMKFIQNISRLLIGLLFIFSGFVKAIDPLGSTYKFTDYFVAFNIEWLSPAALFLAVVLSSIEFVIGFAILNNVYTRISSVLMFIFMSFFTLLTFYLALANPVTDCGCFGDAIKLTNWQTFYKNLVFMIPAGIVFWKRKHFSSRFNRPAQLIIAIVGILISLYISKQSYNHLPAIDFRPYKIGTDINLAMNDNLQGAPQPQFETKIVYEKNGEKKTFTTDNLPDSTWQWVETISNQTDKGYEPPIHNFLLTNNMKQDVTEMVLNDDGFTLMIVAYDIEKLPEASYDMLHEISDVGGANGFNVFIATASNPEDVDQFKREQSLLTKTYYADPITLKTIVRSNPGIVLLKSGMILNKWHYNDFPQANKMSEYHLYKASLQEKHSKTMMLIGFFIGIWLLLSTIFEIVGFKSRYS